MGDDPWQWARMSSIRQYVRFIIFSHFWDYTISNLKKEVSTTYWTTGLKAFHFISCLSAWLIFSVVFSRLPTPGTRGHSGRRARHHGKMLAVRTRKSLPVRGGLPGTTEGTQFSLTRSWQYSPKKATVETWKSLLVCRGLRELQKAHNLV